MSRTTSKNPADGPKSRPLNRLAPGPRPGRRLADPSALAVRPEVAMQAGQLANLLHRRWSTAVLSELHRGDAQPGGAKFITLANRLHVSRETLRDTLIHLIWLQLVRRNTGYGHPMRPEYLLTAAGTDVAPVCETVLKQLGRLDDVAALNRKMNRKWSLPTLFVIGRGASRFGEIKSVLPGITARALTLSLKDLAEAGTITRQVIDEYPPTTIYRLSAAGRRLLRPVSALAEIVAYISLRETMRVVRAERAATPSSR
jgi:DNA-binding HxlR family transcriptional regulator